MLLPWIALFLIFAFAVGTVIYGLVHRVQHARDDYHHWRDNRPH